MVAAEHGTWQPSSEEQSGISGVMRQRLRTLNARIERVNQDQLQLEEARHSLEQRESVLRQGEFKLLQWELVHEKEELQTARLSKLRASKDELEKQISLAHSHFDIELKKLKYEVDRALLCGTELHEVDQLMDSLSGHQLWQSVPGLSLHSETALFDRSMGYIEEMRDASRDDHQRLIAAAAVLATSTMMWRKHIHTLFLLDVHLENMVRTLIQCDSLLRLISPNASQRELVALRLEQHKALLPEPVHSRYEMTFKKWSGLMELSYPRAYGAPLGGVPNGMRAA
ncbi:hypothetical protein RHOFW104T7_10760 [Rhodanobacter thiooxydans]|uniref:Uncharacterized protein n=1 Tax=Rhodanobacter thiooxydans TaxID=416169 RepID=A0A154QIN8_9GAMM|nr:hypothetical protein RHOFW104T7_10760 [Rhodanobacter thiooxydans]